MAKKNVWLMGILLSSSFSAHAKLPLTLEDLITEKGKIKMDLSISYANSNHQGVSVGSLITIQTDQTSFITLPSLVGESQVNRDSMVGISANKAIDSIVFSITTAYQANQTRQDGTHDYQPVNLFLISPSIAFAVNDRVTLTTGMQWTSRQADKWDGHAQDCRRTSSDLLLGASYGVSKASIVSLTFISNVSGSNGANLRLNWQHA